MRGWLLNSIPKKGAANVNENKENMVLNKERKILNNPLPQYGLIYFNTLFIPLILISFYSINLDDKCRKKYTSKTWFIPY